MAALITELIDKQDTNEIVRDQIAAILALEIANQKTLALSNGKNPQDYGFDVYLERLRPFLTLTENEYGHENGEVKNGLVNVSFDNDMFDNKSSDTVGYQKAKGTFYIDCYAHINRNYNSAGDEATSKEADRIARLVRNIIMSGIYTYLGLRKTVTKRYIVRREKFVPSDREGQFFENIVATRITLEVEYIEYSPQQAGVDLELIIVNCEIGEDGLVSFSQQFDYT